MKLTAQFVARNGRSFLTNLMNREQRNFQFDFLRPQHSLFNYFTKLVEQYTKVLCHPTPPSFVSPLTFEQHELNEIMFKVLIPPKSLLGKLRKEVDNPNQVLDQVRTSLKHSFDNTLPTHKPCLVVVL